MARKMLHGAQRRMILDYAGVMSVREQPKKASELEALSKTFRDTDPERYKEAYDVIVNKKVPSANNTALVASKVTEIVEKNISMQESAAVREITNSFHKLVSKTKEDVKLEARAEIDKARKEFVTHQAKIGSGKPKKIKGTMPKEFDRLIQLGAQRKNILMVGPAGCGKTYIAEKIAEALDLEFMSQSCSEGVSESAFTGRLLPMGKGGQFEYVTSQYVRMYENGGVFLLDEFDASDPNVGVFLNQGLAGNGFTLDIRAEKPWVKKHKDFVCIAAANTYGNGADAQYVGRNQLDAATMDRFKIGTVQMDYDEDVEKAIIKSRDEEVYEWGLKIRNAINHHGLRRIMSTRVMQDACDMTQGQEWTLERINKSYFSDWTREERRVVDNTIGTAQ